MNTMRIVVASVCCILGTTFGFAAMKSSWILSLLCGPLQHLGLAISLLNNSDEYIDGVSRVTNSDYIIALFQLTIWLIGVRTVFYWFKCSSKGLLVISIIGWIIIGMLNIYLFAIRSV